MAAKPLRGHVALDDSCGDVDVEASEFVAVAPLAALAADATAAAAQPTHVKTWRLCEACRFTTRNEHKI